MATASPQLDSANDTPTKEASVTFATPPAYFGEALEDAERLLKYAAESGIDVEEDTRDHILQARSAISAGWDEERAANLLAALAKLAARLKPITAASLTACSDNTSPTVRSYWTVAICLAIVILPFSVASFVGSAISNAMRTDIATANDLAVKLRTQLGPPPAATQTSAAATQQGTSIDQATAIAELQQFASATRAIDARARQLNVLVFHAERDPFAPIRNNPTKIHDTFQLPKGLPNLAEADNNLTNVYQDVRYFGQSLLDDVSFFYGAITVCILPALYALLGTCAYLLRTFEQQMATRTFTPSIANSARFLIAAIGGSVVGLFNNFTIGQGASIPPLAIAFLVGYAVDVFFAFLEGMLQAFTKSSTGSPTASSSTKA
ncbi:MAG TPA: hypothetical protein VHY84_07280 [Bryobacteraceae bacterium]|jgi:hypothetical protein|nr:hypothetical protein [Bryobacteraceae bacterium]